MISEEKIWVTIPNMEGYWAPKGLMGFRRLNGPRGPKLLMKTILIGSKENENPRRLMFSPRTKQKENWIIENLNPNDMN